MVTAPWQRNLRRLTERPAARARLVCFPHAGGAASYYLPWVTHLPDSIGLWAVQPPGREDRLNESCVDLMSAARNAAEALQWLTDLPYALFGHSMGALIAYEATRRLEAQRQRGPIHLFVSSCAAPCDHAPATINDNIHDQVIALMRSTGLTSTISHGSDTDALTGPAIRQDLEAFLRYQHTPGPPVSCPVTTLAGKDDPSLSPESIHRWQLHTASSINTIVFDGGHFYLSDHPEHVITEIIRRLTTE
jgi:pyochelin biosynthesis protein PchC